MRYLSALPALALSATIATSLGAQGAHGAHGAMRVAPSGQAITEVVLTLVDSAARAAAKPSKIRIDYGQPHLRGRALLTDSLVPYDKAWRTGANGATMLTTDVDLVIGGSNVPKGTYVLQTMPSRTGWKLLVQKEMGATPMAAAMSYDPALDIARIDMRQSTLSAPLESLTFWLIPSRQPGSPKGELRMAWGAVALSTDWSVK
ncbi:MAG: DUF2911 domain-containing protein [Gemmatimonadaceae bacterium]|nr:DUF2911 domain-containing protein [Gemmatimonadaceae bacterium]